jgi:2,3-bisphosphoglycerate-dependent phosphoglycerate mutase
MKLDINRNLDIPTEENTYSADIPQLEEKYGKEKVDEATHYLTYKDVKELPKDENSDYPTLYVFRHGETRDNADMIFCGWRDIGITDTGINQAKELIKQLKDKKIHMLIASDMKRAIDTMEIAISENEYAKTLEIQQDKRLRERNYGDWQGYSKLIKCLEDYEELHSVRRGYDKEPPHGESLKDTVDRIHGFLDEIIPLMKEEKINVAISCHGNSIRGIRQYFEKLNNQETAEIETPLGQDYAAYAIK